MPWLVQEWDHRDPRNKLDDVDCGHYLEELQNIPDNLRQLLQDGDMHIEVCEIDGKYRVVKIVKKREPEYLQGKDRFFIFDDEGNRIPLSEEEYDELLNLRHNPEDIFIAEEVDLQTLDSDHTAPMDTWDIIFDATEYLSEVDSFIQQYNSGRVRLPPGMTPQERLRSLADVSVYSADWFPYPADKRIHGARAKQIARRIEDESLTKRQLGALLGPREGDQRPRLVREIRAKAQKMHTCREKGTLLVRANKIMEQVHTDRKRRRHHMQPDLVCDSDRSKLWGLWRRKQIEQDGSVKLTSWQFERAYRLKLQKKVTAEEITGEEAQELLVERMKALFSDERPKDVGHELADHMEEPVLPGWIKEDAGLPMDHLPTRQETDRDEGMEDFAPGPGWLSSFQSEAHEDEEEEWLQQVLLSDGEGR
jgi:hypothetical protein